MHVFWIQGVRRQARLRLDESFFVIGRAERFSVFHDDPSISREHAVVVASPEGIRLKDLGSRNGVFVNGSKVDRYGEVTLSPGDEVLVGSTRVRLLGEGEEVTPEDELTVDREGRTELELPPATNLEDTQHGEEEWEDLGSSETEIGEVQDESAEESQELGDTQLGPADEAPGSGGGDTELDLEAISEETEELDLQELLEAEDSLPEVEDFEHLEELVGLRDPSEEEEPQGLTEEETTLE